MAYEVVFPSERVEHEFEKVLRKIPSDYRAAIVEAVRSLGQNPRPPGKSYKKLRGEVTVFRYIAQHRLRVGPYRILFDLDDARKKVILNLPLTRPDRAPPEGAEASEIDIRCMCAVRDGFKHPITARQRAALASATN